MTYLLVSFSDEERDEMGRKGVKWMREKFSWEKCAKELVKAYQLLV